jgi:hypothetical protein
MAKNCHGGCARDATAAPARLPEMVCRQQACSPVHALSDGGGGQNARKVAPLLEWVIAMHMLMHAQEKKTGRGLGEVKRIANEIACHRG